MKKISQLLSCFLLFSTWAYSSEVVEVHQLDQGNCWVQMGKSELSFTHFPGRVSHRQSIGELLNSTGKKFLFCNSSGLYLVENYIKNAKRYCLWKGFVQGHWIELFHGGTIHQEACRGHQLGTLILSLTDEGLEHWEEDQLGLPVHSFERLSSNVLKIVLNEGEDELYWKDELNQNFAESVRSVDLSSQLTHVGEFFKLSRE